MLLGTAGARGERISDAEVSERSKFLTDVVALLVNSMGDFGPTCGKLLASFFSLCFVSLFV